MTLLFVIGLLISTTGMASFVFTAPQFISNPDPSTKLDLIVSFVVVVVGVAVAACGDGCEE